MVSWSKIAREGAADLKLYVYFVALLALVRLAFVGVLREFLGAAAGPRDYVLMVLTGARFDMKTAAFLAAVSFLGASLPAAFSARWPAARLRLWWGMFWAFAVMALVHVRIAYYQEFRDVFGEFLFNTFKDDTHAIAQTIWTEYNFPLRFASIVTTGVLAGLAFRWWLRRPVFAEDTWARAAGWSRGRRAGVTLAFALLLVLSLRGRALGVFTIRDAYVTGDTFLNHAVLDDVNAMRYAYQGHLKLVQSQAVTLEPAAVEAAVRALTGREAPGGDLDRAFAREAKGARVAAPRHIFLIVGESLAAWPFLPAYESLHIADGLKGLAADPESIALLRFLPASSGTMTSLAAILTGNADPGVYTNYQPESRVPYATSFAPQFKRLGYKVRIYYAGFPSWQKVESFALAQGFDSVYCANRTTEATEAWGVPDGAFLRAVARDFDDSAPSVNLILTVSNHAPFVHDVVKEGFDLAAAENKLAALGFTDPKLPFKVGHYWYADRAIAAFVAAMRARFPASLFAITGDHAQRYRASTAPILDEELTVPLILHGAGLRKAMLPPGAAGSHLQIAPTLVELVAPAGTPYASLLPSLTEAAAFGYHRDAWISADAVAWASPARPSPGFVETARTLAEQRAARETYNALRTVSSWRILKGKLVK
jgi:phosphoglycerol transferase MdoB-like AlkP superfamily enzyme